MSSSLSTGIDGEMRVPRVRAEAGGMVDTIIENFGELRNRDANAAVRARYRRGELVRLCRGAYCPTDVWLASNIWSRYRLVINATAMVWPDTVFCYETAAFLWGYPLLSLPCELVSAVERPGNVRTTPPSRLLGTDPPSASEGNCAGDGFGMRRRLLRDAEVVAHPSGVLVTSRAQTAADCAGSLQFAPAVAILDCARAKGGAASVDDAEIAGWLERLSRPGQRSRARRAMDYSDPRSESPGESMSRANMYTLGFAAPQLQFAIADERGTFARADYYWPEVNLVGEFDGVGKYLRAAAEQNRSVGDIVMAEKNRENRIRQTGCGVVRWDWNEARDLRRFEAILQRAGVPRDKTSRWA